MSDTYLKLYPSADWIHLPFNRIIQRKPANRGALNSTDKLRLWLFMRQYWWKFIIIFRVGWVTSQICNIIQYIPYVYLSTMKFKTLFSKSNATWAEAHRRLWLRCACAQRDWNATRKETMAFWRRRALSKVATRMRRAARRRRRRHSVGQLCADARAQTGHEKLITVMDRWETCSDLLGYR